MTPREVEELRTYIHKNLQCGFIQLAKPWVATPVLFREKKDGPLHLCMDYHRVNAVCVENLYPLSLMKDILAHLAKGKVFYKIGLTQNILLSQN